MSIDSETRQILDEGFGEILRKYPPFQENATMTDILLQVNTDTGLFTILNDDDDEIYSAVIEEWIENSAEEENPDSDTAMIRAGHALKQYIRNRKEELSNLSLLKPYSFVLVDADKESVEELYLVDDDTIVLDQSTLMQGLDEDLDNFFQKLMKE